MKKLITAIIIITGIGTFLSGFVSWMASSSYKQAMFLEQHGEYTEVVVVKKQASFTGSNKHRSKSYYVNIAPAAPPTQDSPIRCGVGRGIYEQLEEGGRLHAWILDGKASLDIGPKNAQAVADRLLIVCIVCGVAFLVGIGLKIGDRKGLISLSNQASFQHVVHNTGNEMKKLSSPFTLVVKYGSPVFLFLGYGLIGTFSGAVQILLLCTVLPALAAGIALFFITLKSVAISHGAFIINNGIGKSTVVPFSDVKELKQTHTYCEPGSYPIVSILLQNKSLLKRRIMFLPTTELRRKPMLITEQIHVLMSTEFSQPLGPGYRRHGAPQVGA